MTIENLQVAAQAQREAASRFCEAAHEFAREANGNRGHIIPAPVVYDMLGELKVALWHVSEVVGFLPRGVRYSLADPRLAVYDRDPGTGEQRDAGEQAEVAAGYLRSALACLSLAARSAESAQAALSGQGYDRAG